MLIHKLHVPSKLSEQLLRREEPLVDGARVEEEFGTGGGVDEGGDEFVEGGEKEGDVDDESAAEAFGVVGLEEVEELLR